MGAVLLVWNTFRSCQVWALKVDIYAYVCVYVRARDFRDTFFYSICN